MRVWALLVVLSLAACTRPLTEAEEAFAASIFGDSLDPAAVGIAKNLALLPPPRQARVTRIERRTPRAHPCRRTPQPGRSGPPPGVAFQNTIFLQGESYAADTLELWPGQMRVPQVFIMAHELTHIWQWQNREVTGYTPWRAASESFTRVDAYFYDLTLGKPFLDYGYEQQAAMVEDYVCYLYFDPNAPERAALRRVLSGTFPIEALERTLGAAR